MNPSHPPILRNRRARTATVAVAGLVAALLPAASMAGSSAASAASTTSLSGVVVAASSAATAPSAGQQAARRPKNRKPYWKFVTSEQFNRLDPKRWGTFNGTPGCCPDAEWDPSMVKVRNGQLQLHTAPRNGRWLSGGVGGWGWAQGARTYGRWDARIRFDKGQGVSAAALLWPSANSWPPELDFYEIFETWGNRDKMSVTTHWQANGAHQKSQRVVKRNFSRWHVASVRWLPGRVAYFLDGRRIKVDTSAARIPRAKMWVGFQTHAHRINGQYARLPEGKSSVALSVDWVKVYKRNR